MSLFFWRKRHYSYSDPFLVTVNYMYARYAQWRRDDDTGRMQLVWCKLETIFVGHEVHKAPDSLACFPPLVSRP